MRTGISETVGRNRFKFQNEIGPSKRNITGINLKSDFPLDIELFFRSCYELKSKVRLFNLDIE